MGSACRILLMGSESTAEPLRARLEELEAQWSRFRPESQVSIMNAYAGRPVLVPDDVVRLVSHAVHAWRLTEGLYDPTMLTELESHGYDRSHERLPAPEGLSITDPSRPARQSLADQIDIDVVLGAVTLPEGLAFDPGGIGKGLAADILMDLVGDASGALIDLGGDLRLEGQWVDGGPWPVGVSDPFDLDRNIASLSIARGGVATSSSLRRKWRGPDGFDRHHLLDPRTGEPADTDLVAVTVNAGTAWVADVVAKAAVIGGSDYAREIIRVTHTAGLLIDRSGETEIVGPLEAEIYS